MTKKMNLESQKFCDINNQRGIFGWEPCKTKMMFILERPKKELLHVIGIEELLFAVLNKSILDV